MGSTATAENPRAVIGDNNPPLSDRLSSDYEELTERVASALSAAREIPAVIETEKDNDRVAESVKALRALLTEAEEARTRENRPHLEAQRTINAFFKSLTERLQKGKDILEKRGRDFLTRKMEEERRRREEAERIAREEAERKEREARAAEAAGRTVQAEIVLDQAVAAEERAELAAKAASASNAELARTRTSSGVATVRTAYTFEIINLSEVPLEPLRPYLGEAEISKAIRGFVRNGGRQLKGVRIFEDTKAQYR